MFKNSKLQFLNPSNSPYSFDVSGFLRCRPPPGGAAQRLLRSGATVIRPPRLQMRFLLITVISKQEFQAGSAE